MNGISYMILHIQNSFEDIRTIMDDCYSNLKNKLILRLHVQPYILDSLRKASVVNA